MKHKFFTYKGLSAYFVVAAYLILEEILIFTKLLQTTHIIFASALAIGITCYITIIAYLKKEIQTGYWGYILYMFIVQTALAVKPFLQPLYYQIGLMCLLLISVCLAGFLEEWHRKGYIKCTGNNLLMKSVYTEFIFVLTVAYVLVFLELILSK